MDIQLLAQFTSLKTEMLTPHGSAAFSYMPPCFTIASSSKNGIWLTFPTCSSSVLLNPVNAFPVKMDLPALSVTLTRALYEGSVIIMSSSTRHISLTQTRGRPLLLSCLHGKTDRFSFGQQHTVTYYEFLPRMRVLY